MTNHRSMVLFESSIKSKYTAMNYNSHLKQFMKFIGIKSVEKILLIPPTQLQHNIEDYLIMLKTHTNPNSVPSKLQGIKHFCIMNDIYVNWDKIRRMFPAKQKPHNLRSYTAAEINMMLNGQTHLRNKALIHFLASTGARIGVFDHPLQIKHMRNMPEGCCAILLYAGDIEEYWSFLTPQAHNILVKYFESRKQMGELFGPNTPIFHTGERQLGWSGARSVVYRIILKSGISRYKTSGRYDVQADHGFRKRFNTILKLDNSVNYNIAEKLMGHKNGLDGTYLTPTIEEMFAEFRKVINKLKI